MRYWLGWIAGALAIGLLLLTFVNASWLAPSPRGAVRLIAHRGISQLFHHRGLTDRDCTAKRIEVPVHDRIEDSVRSMRDSAQMGADMVQVDLASTADGRIALFHDRTLDCRTDGRGAVRDRTLAELQALDPGYGYSTDGGKTFPLRGLRRDRIASLEEGLAALPATAILFTFQSRDPAEADRLIAALKAIGRDVELRGDGFTGDPAPIAHVRDAFPTAWTYTKPGATACTMGYLRIGWLGFVPDACRNGTIMVPIDRQWLFPGWPNRLIARMAAVGARVMIVGPRGSPDLGLGLTLPEQLGEVPDSFKGYIYVDDIWTLGPALRPDRDIRTEAQQKLAEQGLARRRARAD
ncbi:MAG: glycerophosphodiester phosphodiesterase family protein [Sphingomicrobium sp.]|nr:glycerophosphodiester phosphodiesterase [Sphingomonadales bacterium]